MIPSKPMRATALALSAAALLLPEGPALADTILVYLQAGQSNTDGRAAASGLQTTPVNLRQPQNDVAYFYRNPSNGADTFTTLRPGSSTFGPEITFGRSMADFYAKTPDTSIAILKYAKGGTSLNVNWKAGGDATTTGDGDQYKIFQSTVSAGLTALKTANPTSTITIAGMIWMQGENDAGTAAKAALYQTNLTNFIADVRATYGSDLPFVIGRLSNNQTAIDAAGLATVRAAQTTVAGAGTRTGLVDTDGFGVKSDNLHFDAQGQQALGSSFASQMRSIPEPGRSTKRADRP